MKNSTIFYILILSALLACNTNQQGEKTNYISIPSLIEEQVAHVDTSLYMIIKTTARDSLVADTEYIRREDFRIHAEQFLNLPDLSDQKIANKFVEEAARYDELLGRVIITYSPKDNVAEPYKKLELMITPNPATGDKVNNVIAKKILTSRDGYLEKNMLWQMDKSFLITTIQQKPGEPPTVINEKVVWND